MSTFGRSIVGITVVAAGVMALVVVLGRTPQRATNVERVAVTGHTQTLNHTHTKVSTSTYDNAITDLVGPCPPAVLRWDTENVFYWLRCLGAPANRFALALTNVIVATAVANNVPVTSNICDFTRALYYLPFTNDRQAGVAASILRDITNRMVTSVLFDIWTNEHGKVHKMPETGSVVNRTAVLIDALRKMGTPEVIEQLNQTWAELNKGEPWRSPPGETISPDHYSREAREWLFTHWSPTVRARMVDRWLESERPDTPDVLRLYIKKLEGTAVEDPYWGPTNAWARDPFNRLPASRAYEKQAWIAEIKDKTEHYARKYRRWLKDKQRMPLHYGCYRDDNWVEYRRLSEEDRRRRYGKQYGSPVLIKGTY